MDNDQPKITVCIPHWQVKVYMTLCLRSIRKHSQKYDLEVIVVDNGSRDESLNYLRALPWIRLIERPEEVHTNWPMNVFTAWDLGIRQATGDYFITMHSDVFVKSDDWLDPLLREISHDPSVAAAGAWKLELENRTNGVIKRGKTPTTESVEKQCKSILSRQHLKRVIGVSVIKGSDGIPRLGYTIDTDAVHELSNTYLGKTIIITSREGWDNEKIITAYRSQFIIEDVFKEMKDRNTGSWWPMHHWTDSKIRVHGLYCTIALLIRALMFKRVRKAGLRLSMKRVLSELDAIREVVNIYPRKRRQKIERKQAVLSKLSEVQQQLMSLLMINKEENSVLG